ncbi:MAG: hypothetical protein J6D03_01060 [Clostridia bacterium]|nr:hypothetical protein [Clostridia bacterium]
MEKILIVGSSIIDKMKIAERLTSYDESFSIAYRFTSNIEYKDMKRENNNLHIYYNDNESINLDYKNNSLLYIHTSDMISYGVTIDEFINTDITVLDTLNFNTISDKLLNNNNIFIVWIDTKFDKKNSIDFKETKFLMDRIDNYPYMYFMDTDNIDDICKEVLKYVNAKTKDEKLEILNENS